MTIIDGLIWLFLLGMPIYSYFTYQAEIKAIQAGTKSLSTSYWQTILLLWPPAILALFSEHFSIPIIDQSNDYFLWGVIALSLLCLLFSYGIYQVKHSEKARETVTEQMATISWLMPKTTKQLSLFLLGVCTTAGIAEEIIYRGYLLPFLTQYMEQYIAVIVASLLFGLPHIYQKVTGVFKTALLGVIFCITVIIFDSLIFAIVFHFLIDAYSGYIGYLSLKKKSSC